MPSAPGQRPSPDRFGQESTRLGFDRGAKGLIIGVCAGLGVLLGVVVAPIADFATGLAWVPFQGPLELISSAQQSWIGWLLLVLGLVVGLLFAAAILHDSPVLHVTREAIRVDQKGQVRTIKRQQVATVFRDGSKVVLETAQGRTLFRGDIEGGRDAVREAFQTHGYPWDAEHG